MAVYTVFCHGVQRKYKTNLCSKATVFVVFLTVVTVVAPFVFAHRGLGKFAIKINSGLIGFQPSLAVCELSRLSCRLQGFGKR